MNIALPDEPDVDVTDDNGNEVLSGSEPGDGKEQIEVSSGQEHSGSNPNIVIK